jgi:hypothetical protein
MKEKCTISHDIKNAEIVDYASAVIHPDFRIGLKQMTRNPQRHMLSIIKNPA